ncbi:MAG TPA: hypothetical protein PK657_04550 [Legionella sp.]|nr:hypothetical protein [Legionella sp.]
MKKVLVAVVLSAPLLMLTGCGMDAVAVNNVVYDPGYSNDYVYSVGYYNNRPYWGNNYYYTGYNWGTGGYWGGGYYNGY